MVKNLYTPDRGDIVWINLDPSIGHEQAGKRPALVVSPKYYNSKSKLVLLCPITSKEKGYTLECAVRIKKIQGAVLIDQLRGVDWGARKIKFIEKIDSKTLADILYKLSLLVS